MSRLTSPVLAPVDLPRTGKSGAPPQAISQRRVLAGMIVGVADEPARSEGSVGRPDPPRFQAEGRPPHDFFADGQVIRLRLSPDYTPSEWVPLWPSSDCTDALVSPDLLHELIAWQEVFLQNFHPDKGWRSKEAMDHWAAKAIQLEAELRAELAGKANLEVDLWPLPQGERSWKTKGW